MKNEIEDLVKVVKAALEYIDAIPKEVADSFPVMPGFDRDWAEELIFSAPIAYQKLADENVALKKFCKNAAFDADYEAELGMERGGFTDALNNIETPATDGIIFEINIRSVDILQESAYRAGLTAGWNFGIENNAKGFNKCFLAHSVV